MGCGATNSEQPNAFLNQSLQNSKTSPQESSKKQKEEPYKTFIAEPKTNRKAINNGKVKSLNKINISTKNQRDSSVNVRKTQKKQALPKQRKDYLTSSLRSIGIRQSKIKLDLKELASQNEEQVNQLNVSQKKKRKNKRKKTFFDPVLSELIKIYGL